MQLQTIPEPKKAKDEVQECPRLVCIKLYGARASSRALTVLYYLYGVVVNSAGSLSLGHCPMVTLLYLQVQTLTLSTDCRLTTD